MKTEKLLKLKKEGKQCENGWGPESHTNLWMREYGDLEESYSNFEIEEYVRGFASARDAHGQTVLHKAATNMDFECSTPNCGHTDTRYKIQI